MESNGNLDWVDVMGGPNGSDASGIATDSQGDVDTSGEFAGTGLFYPPVVGSYYLTSDDGSEDAFLTEFTQSTPPTVTLSGPAAVVTGETATFQVAATDASPSDEAAGFTYSINWGDGSAVQTIAATPGNGSGVTVTHVYIAAGSYTVQATATDQGGTSSTPATLTQVVSQAGTGTSLSASTNPLIPGQNSTFTATVAALSPGSGVPTGTIQFVLDGNNFGSAIPLINGTASISMSFEPGSHVIEAIYSGDSNYLGSNDSVTQTVTQSIYVLDPSAAGALTISGNSSLNVPGNLIVDSSSSTALSASGNATVKASSILVVGKIQQSGNPTFSPAPVSGVAAVANPLQNLTGPSSTGITNYGAVAISGSTSRTINPGIYSQISISGNALVTFNPGLYLIEGGGFTVSGTASVVGSGVTLYNTSSNYPSATGAYGGITLSGSGSINLSAPISGPYTGVVILQPSANTRALSVSGNATGLVGTLYAPAAQVIISGNARLNAALVVDRLSISGNGASTEVADGSGDSPLDQASAGTLLAGDLSVYVNDPAGYFTANELNRLQDAISVWNSLLAPYSVTITEVSDPALANVVIDDGTSSAAGSAADGVLGCYSNTGEITILQGWNWYDGADPTQIGANQYDFQTVMTHELGHALGLGGNSNPNSPMYEILATAIVRRTPGLADLNIPEAPDGADAERAADLSVSPNRFVNVAIASWLTSEEAIARPGLGRAHGLDWASNQVVTGVTPLRGIATNPPGPVLVGVSGTASDALGGSPGRFDEDSIMPPDGPYTPFPQQDGPLEPLDPGCLATSICGCNPAWQHSAMRSGSAWLRAIDTIFIAGQPLDLPAETFPAFPRPPMLAVGDEARVGLNWAWLAGLVAVGWQEFVDRAKTRRSPTNSLVELLRRQGRSANVGQAF
jgi:hypothetical protein